MKQVRRTTFAKAGIAVVAVMMLGIFGVAQQAEKTKPEFYQATAQGTSTQLGQMVSVNITVREYSGPEEQKGLIEAFQAKGAQGLFNAVSKMKSKGRLAITGTLGYDIKYVRQFPTADGKKIRVLTDRPIGFGEAWADSRSMDYNLSAVELLVSKTKGKSSGTLLPACQFKLDKENEIEIENYRNPWKLANVLIR